MLAPSWPNLVSLGFYVPLNTVQVISRRVVGRAEETSTYIWSRFCTVCFTMVCCVLSVYFTASLHLTCIFSSQFAFVVVFSVFLLKCVDYQTLFYDRWYNDTLHKVTIPDGIYSTEQCLSRYQGRGHYLINPYNCMNFSINSISVNFNSEFKIVMLLLFISSVYFSQKYSCIKLFKLNDT